MPSPNPQLRPSSVIIKFTDTFVSLFDASGGIPYTPAQIGRITARLGHAWTALEALYPGMQLLPLFTTVTPQNIQSILDLARLREPGYDPPRMLGFFELELPQGTDLADVARRLMSLFHGVVEIAYPEPFVTLPQAPVNDPHFKDQGYLNAGTDGVGATCAWPITMGSGQRLIDVEGGWKKSHVDLPDPRISLKHGIELDIHRPHGTAVLGIVCAIDNTAYGVGIAPHISSVHLVSTWREGHAKRSVHSALWYIAHEAYHNRVDIGDVVLLELQGDFDDYHGRHKHNMPIETGYGTFVLVRLLTALGLVVVEAAGTWENDLDKFQDTQGLYVFDRRVRDSRAIMVAGCVWNSVGLYYEPAQQASNFGDRVDCFAWGGGVYTTWCDPVTLMDGDILFGGTSAASAIIAGTAILVQGLRESAGKLRYRSKRMRRVLRDPNNSTAPRAQISASFGVMPDLCKIIERGVLLEEGEAPE